MIEDLGGVTARLVVEALNISSLRQSVTANNIANANTPGFSPARVKFEELINSAAIYSPSPANDAALDAELDAVLADGDLTSLVSKNKNDKIELDIEMVNLTENVIRYRTLLSALGKRGEILGLAVKEGRNQ